MPKPLGFLSSDRSQLAASPQHMRNLDSSEPAAVLDSSDEDGPCTPSAAEREQLARDIAAIEQAAAALRQAQPRLRSWVGQPSGAPQRPRPIWVLIGMLWVSTALVTLGAVYALSAFVG